MFAQFGSISHGTMRTEDLLETFADELEGLGKREAPEMADVAKTNAEQFAEWLKAQSKRDKLIAEAREIDPDTEEATDIVEELIDALQEYAPPYAYFGAHPGDGADYGFWLDENMPEDFDGLKVDDTSEVPADYDGEVLHVNDHGNMTLYVANKGELTEVWAVV